MKLSEIHSEVVARLNASSALAPFLPILVEDNFTDFMPQIQDGMDKRGATILVADVEGGQLSGTESNSIFNGEASFSIEVYDAPANAGLSGLALVEAVSSAIISSPNQYFKRITPANFARGTREGGGVLTVISFNAQFLNS